MGQTIRNLRRYMYRVTIADAEAAPPIRTFFYLPSPSVLAACAIMDKVTSVTIDPIKITVDVAEGPNAGPIHWNDIIIVGHDNLDDDPPDLKDFMPVVVFGGDWYYIPKTSGDLCIIQDVLNYYTKATD